MRRVALAAVAVVAVVVAAAFFGIDPILSLGGLVLLGTALVIVAGAFFQAWWDTRQEKVVITTIEDATGDDVTKSAVAGLTHLLREELVGALPKLAGRMKKEIQDAKSDPTSPLASLVVADAAVDRDRLLDDIGSSQKELSDSITSLAPESARGALQIVTETLLRPRGVRVSAVLQRRSDAAGGLGVSFTVSPLQGEGPPRRVTLWEDRDTDVSGKTLVERFHDLIVPLSRSLACELLRRHLATRMEKRRLPLAGAGESQREARKAVVEFGIGTAYLSAAARYAPATMSFYVQAERALANAARLDHYRVWYLRAEVLAQRGRRAADGGIDLFHEAISLLDKAREELPKAGLADHDRRAVDLNIRSGRAIVECLLVRDEPWRAKAAAEAISELRRVDTSGLEGSSSVQDTTVLYNLGSAFAAASGVEHLFEHGLDRRDCLVRSAECILQACLADEQWLDDGKVDLDLRPLWTKVLDARRQLLALAGDGRPDRAAVCSAVREVLAEPPKTAQRHPRQTAPGADGAAVQVTADLSR